MPLTEKFHTFPRNLAAAVSCALLTVTAAGCGEDKTTGEQTEKIKVTATTTQVGDLVKNIGGDRVQLVQLLSPNSDPHDYEPRPDDAVAIADSKVVFRSGRDLDSWLGGLINQSGQDIPQVDLSKNLKLKESTEHAADEHSHEEEEHTNEAEHSHEEEEHDHGELDPHWWQDPTNAIQASETVRDQLIKLDPENRDSYLLTAREFIGELEATDKSIASCFNAIPKKDRKIVTNHDALSYFTDRYKIEIIGTVMPSLSTEAQVSAGDIDDLVKLIKKENVKTIFPESSINTKLAKAIAKESGATVGTELWADTLGPKGSSGDTYIKSLKSNARSIAEGISEELPVQCERI